jgi:hypothetical protein
MGAVEQSSTKDDNTSVIAVVVESGCYRPSWLLKYSLGKSHGAIECKDPNFAHNTKLTFPRVPNSNAGSFLYVCAWTARM